MLDPTHVPDALGRRVAIVAMISLSILFVVPSALAQTGLVPLTDLGAGTYAGYPGGLYPGGANVPPAAHASAALARAAEIVPRDAAGNPSPTGWIGMIAVGMSNTTHEFGAFERNADADSARNARVVIIDTGFGGQTASIIADPNASYWTTMMQRLAAMAITPAQVQVAWLKEADAQPPNNFPIHAQALRDSLKKVCNNLHAKFPQLRICYVSSRIYGGYSAQGTLNPEPQAYESGFSAKWLIEDQINGDPELNDGAFAGDVRSPLLLWGPYLWADGTNPRSDGLTWQLADLESDHVHPSPSGEQKVSALLQHFFATDPTAAPWWPAQSGARLVALDALEDAYVTAASAGTNFGADPHLIAQGGASPIQTYMRFDAGGFSSTAYLAKLSLRVDQAGGGAVQWVADNGWDESTITYSNAPSFGPSLVNMPQSSRDGTIGANVTNAVRGDADGLVSFALTTPSAGAATYHSKEAGEPPRLILVMPQGAASVSESPSGHGIRGSVPNPFSSGTRITFQLKSAGWASLTIHSIDGRRVRTLAGPWSAGRHDAWWDGRDERGRSAPPGIYLVRLAGSDGPSFKIARIR